VQIVTYPLPTPLPEVKRLLNARSVISLLVRSKDERDNPTINTPPPVSRMSGGRIRGWLAVAVQRHAAAAAAGRERLSLENRARSLCRAPPSVFFYYFWRGRKKEKKVREKN